MRESTTASEFQALPGTNFSDFFPIRNTLLLLILLLLLSLSLKTRRKKKKTEQNQTNKQTLGSIIAVVVAQNIHE
jgi:membrane protein implicated in regulation of membrane protease activity